MATALLRTDPTPLIVLKALQASGATGTYGFMHIVRIPFNATSTGTGAANTTNWVNPESGTVMAQAFVSFRTAGTGTFSLGRTNDATSTGSGMIGPGTLTVGVHWPGTVLGTVAGSATAGGIDTIYWLIGPGGTGTNNSITLSHTDTPTSTAVGELVIAWTPVL